MGLGCEVRFPATLFLTFLLNNIYICRTRLRERLIIITAALPGRKAGVVLVHLVDVGGFCTPRALDFDLGGLHRLHSSFTVTEGVTS